MTYSTSVILNRGLSSSAGREERELSMLVSRCLIQLGVGRMASRIEIDDDVVQF